MKNCKILNGKKIFAFITISIITLIILSAPLYACSGSKTSEGIEYTLMAREGYYVVSGIGECTDSDIVIPETYKDLPVQEIEMFAFYGCKTIKSVYIPDSVTEIGGYAFWSCTALESVVIGSGVTSISNAAFYNCPALYSVTFKNIEGWSVSGKELSSEDLADTLTAATYLADTYSLYAFKNSANEDNGED